MPDKLHSFTLADAARENGLFLAVSEAVVCGADRLTYGEVDTRSSLLAAALSEAGVAPGDCVVWIGHNCHRFLELLFACAKLGAVAVPLNWRWTAAEIRANLAGLAVAAVLASGSPEFESAARAAVAATGKPVIYHDTDDYEERLAAQRGEPRATADSTDDDAVLGIFTAAFSGRPRVARITHRAIVTQSLVLAAFGIVNPGQEVYLCSGPMFHIGALLQALATFHLGGRVVVLQRAEPGDICDQIEKERCTSAFLVPVTIQAIVEHDTATPRDLTSLRRVMSLPPEPVAERWYQITSCQPPERPGFGGYGQTETYGMVSLDFRQPLSASPFGRPSPAAIVRVVDEAGRELAPGEMGEIAARGPLVMAGYAGEPSLPPGSWWRTGDLGVIETDGGLRFCGPKTDLIKSGLENIYPVEVENAIRSHEAVADVCVIGVSDPRWGESVRAVVQLRENFPIGPDDLIRHVQEQIASYKKPKSVIIVDALPRSGSAVDRDAVKDRYGS